MAKKNVKEIFFKKKSKSGRAGAPSFCPISQEPDLSQTCGFHQELPNIMLYHLKAFAKCKDKIVSKQRKGPFRGNLGHFCPISRQTRFFLENLAPNLENLNIRTDLFTSIYNVLVSNQQTTERMDINSLFYLIVISVKVDRMNSVQSGMLECL